MAYDPTQPRIPAGDKKGGQWTSESSLNKIANAARKAAGLPIEEGWSTGNDLKTAQKFIDARNGLSADKAKFLSDYTAEELVKSGKQIYIHEDGKNGFIIDNGDLQNLFSTNHQGVRSLLLAKKMGAETLDCFDGVLPKFYSKFGFIEIKREANWEPGGPDVVWMKLKEG